MLVPSRLKQFERACDFKLQSSARHDLAQRGNLNATYARQLIYSGPVLGPSSKQQLILFSAVDRQPQSINPRRRRCDGANTFGNRNRSGIYHRSAIALIEYMPQVGT